MTELISGTKPPRQVCRRLSDIEYDQAGRGIGEKNFKIRAGFGASSDKGFLSPLSIAKAHCRYKHQKCTTQPYSYALDVPYTSVHLCSEYMNSKNQSRRRNGTFMAWGTNTWKELGKDLKIARCFFRRLPFGFYERSALPYGDTMPYCGDPRCLATGLPR